MMQIVTTKQLSIVHNVILLFVKCALQNIMSYEYDCLFICHWVLLSPLIQGQPSWPVLGTTYARPLTLLSRSSQSLGLL
jgi:hypothetical protein